MIKKSTKEIVHCHFHRWLISESLNEGKLLLDITKDHIRNCGSCYKYMKSSAVVVEKLEAPAESVDYPPHLHDKIMAGIRCESVRECRPLVFWKPVFAVAALVILLLSALIFVAQQSDSGSKGSSGFLAELNEAGLPGLAGVIDDEAQFVHFDSRIEDLMEATFKAEVELLKDDLASLSGNVDKLIATFEQLALL